MTPGRVPLYRFGVNTVTRDNWRDKARESGLTLIELAARTGKSFSAVYAYSRGARRPSDEWITLAGDALVAYLREWTCPECKTRNSDTRYSCGSCARAFDGYAPSVLRPTAHGMAQ